MYAITKINIDVIKAYSVHLFTTMGIVCGIFAVKALYEKNLDIVFLWLGIALLIDGTDGFFARKYQVTKFAPRINGVILDAIVDFFNYVILPVLIILQIGFLPDRIEFLSVVLILCASCYTFANIKQKAEDNYFNGFPAIWNVLVLDFYILNSPEIINFIAIILCFALTFMPIKFVHPLRVKSYRWLAILSFSLWGISTLFLLFVFDDKTLMYYISYYAWILSNIFIMLFSIIRTIYRKA
ncbi:MAG: phosphatidylcholine synthase [Dehalococcoidia bacterium]|nr:phosphatidylcholine synthase [Dehalococcoidia bacterium]|tara:strand:+ start:60 stop:779 length:720 start_codon:yes stop_codon:yes gene_type:complete